MSLLLSTIAFSISAMTQNPCGTDSILEIHRIQHSDYFKDQQKTRYTTPLQSAKQKVETSYVIPIAVHVIHKGETIGSGNNLTDQQIYAAIDSLNARFSGSHDSSIQTNIQFVLAKRDPQRCASTGITRHPMSDINFAFGFDQSIKKHASWPVQDYFNIYVVPNDQITPLGYAYYPTERFFEYDGIVIQAGEIKQNTGVLAHEMGHALNLMHTFEGGCGGSACDSTGDWICDTPPHHQQDCGPTSNCNTTISILASTTNFMSYCTNRYRFSSGQKERMRYSFQLLSRASLLTSPGLDSSEAVEARITLKDSMCSGLVEVQLMNLGREPLDSIQLFVPHLHDSIFFAFQGILNTCEDTLVYFLDSLYTELGLLDSMVVFGRYPNGDSNIASIRTARLLPLPAGEYTVGDSNSDFSSLLQVQNKLNTAGICGSVTFALIDGNYRQTLLLTNQFGLSDSTSITFTSAADDSGKVHWIPDSLRAVIELDNGGHLRLKHLSFGSNYYNLGVVHPWSSCLDLKWDRCQFTDIIGLSAKERTQLVHMNRCGFNNATAFALSGGPDMTDMHIDSCRFQSSRALSGVVSRFSIQHSQFSGAGYTPILTSVCYGNIRIVGNTFSNQTVRTIWIKKYGGGGNSNIRIMNNFFNPTGGNIPIQLEDCPNSYIYHNTVLASDSAGSAGVVLRRSPATRIMNNIFYTPRGYSIYLDSGYYYLADYNAVYTTHIDSGVTKPYLTHLGYIDMANWRALGHGLHSVEMPLTFQSADTPYVCATNLDNTGFPLQLPKEDLYGHLRDSFAPDIGCLEFASPELPIGLQEYYFTCDSLRLHPTLDSSRYKHHWPDGSTGLTYAVYHTDTVLLSIHDLVCKSRILDTAIVERVQPMHYQLVEPAAQCDSNQLIISGTTRYYRILWNTGDSTPDLTLYSSDSVWFQYTDSAGCIHYSDTALLEVRPTPDIQLGSDTSILQNDTLILDAGPLTNGRYWWSNMTSDRYLEIRSANWDTGFHIIWVYAEQDIGCSARDTVKVHISGSSSGSIVMPSAQIAVFPNPSHGDISVSMPDGEAVQCQLFNLQNQQIWDRTYSQSGVLQIDLDQPTGIYLLLLQQGAKRYHARIVVY